MFDMLKSDRGNFENFWIVKKVFYIYVISLCNSLSCFKKYFFFYLGGIVNFIKYWIW